MAGHETYPLSADELAAWRKSAEPVVTNWQAAVRKANEDPKAIFDDLRKTVAEYKSAY